MIANDCINFQCLPDAVRLSPANVNSNAHTETIELALKAIHCTAVYDLILIINMIIINEIQCLVAGCYLLWRTVHTHHVRS